MKIQNVRRKLLSTLLCLTITVLSAQFGFSQESQPKRDEQTNLDLQLYVLVASNQGSLEGKVPAVLDPVVKHLHETLPFRNYSLSSTLMNRVKSGGNLSLKWIVGPLSNQSSMPTTPTFNEFSIARVGLENVNGIQMIQMLRFSFGSRVPIQTGTTIAVSGTNSAPVVNWEPVGLVTDISVKENEPAVVGTLNIGPSGEVIVLAVSVKRAN
jgi:hypothetical protein